MIKKIILILFVLVALSATPALAQELKTFTVEELSQFDGQDGRQAYFAYEGKVYDVTQSPLFKLGKHFGHNAGEDLTGKLENAPHGMEVFAPFKIVGTYEDSGMSNQEEAGASEENEVMKASNDQVGSKWYEGRIRIMGLSILGLTGIILGIFFVMTFATCFEMPWAKFPVPWKGKRPGLDSLDASARHLPWTSLHKYFVWFAVIFGVIHGVIGFMQLLFGIYL